MSRDADYRYQTLSGLIYDLETLLKNYEVTGRADSFTLGREDKHHRLNLKKYIFGRDNEISAMNSAILDNETTTIIISGKSGIGKTYLINKVIDQYKKQCAIIDIKFDQTNTTMDDGIDQILKQLNHFIKKSNSNDLMNNWTEAYVNFKSDSDHSKSNYIYLIESLINMASSIQKLIIVLDDIQWMNTDAKNILNVAIENCKNTTFIFSTREPFETIKKQTHFNQASTILLNIKELNQQDIIEKVIATFKCNKKNAIELSKKLMSKTYGNPLHVHELIKNLIINKAIWFDKTSCSWEWNNIKIDQIQVSDDVAELLIKTIDSLPKESQLILHFAGILGCHFNSQTIANILNKDPISVELNLWHAIKKDLIIENQKELNEFIFSHDKIQLACVNQPPFR